MGSYLIARHFRSPGLSISHLCVVMFHFQIPYVFAIFFWLQCLNLVGRTQQYKEMFGSLVGMLSKLKENKTVQTLKENITDNYHKLKEQVLRNYEITEVLPQIYHAAFPEPESIALLKAHIGNHEFQIWNVSEYRYQAEVERQLQGIAEQGEVQHLCFSMYSNPPFYQLVLAINTIHRFTQARDTRVYVHCQDSRVRSALLLACYIYRHRLVGVEDISQAILFVNRALGVRLDQPEGKLHKNMHLLLKNFVNYLNDFHSINKLQLKLLKIIVNNPPRLNVKGWNEATTRISLEMRCGEQSAFKMSYGWQAVQGNILCVTPQKKNIVFSDQFLLIVKYLFDGKVYNVFRIQLNTNFIYQCFSRVQQNEIDLGDSAGLNPNQFMHVDFMFEEGKEWSQLARLEEGGLQEQGKNVKIEEKQPIHSECNQQAIVEAQTKIQNEVHQVHQEAIASLNQGIGDIAEQDCTTIDIVQEINQKLSQTIKTEEPQQDRPADDSEQEQEQQDLDDYMSKLQSQA